MWQAFLCMISFFAIFWWHGVPIEYVYNNGIEFWGGPESKHDLGIGTGCTGPPGQAPACRYLTVAEQRDLYYQAQSAWFITLVSCQFWHIWVCKTRRVSIFEHGLFRNLITVWGTTISITVMIIAVYAPFLQGIFSTANMVGIGWVAQLGFPLVFVPYTELVKKLAREDPDGWVATHLCW